MRSDKTSRPNREALYQISSYCSYATSDCSVITMKVQSVSTQKRHSKWNHIMKDILVWRHQIKKNQHMIEWLYYGKMTKTTFSKTEERHQCTKRRFQQKNWFQHQGQRNKEVIIQQAFPQWKTERANKRPDWVKFTHE